MSTREFRALVHEENGGYWAEVEELPGCFASGRDLDELRTAIAEAIDLYLTRSTSPGTAREGTVTTHVDVMRVLVS